MSQYVIRIYSRYSSFFSVGTPANTQSAVNLICYLVIVIIMINQNKMIAKAFDYTDGDGSGELDLYAFTDHLLTTTNRPSKCTSTKQTEKRQKKMPNCNF